MKKYFIAALLFSSLQYLAQPSFTITPSICQQGSLTVVANTGSIVITGYTWTSIPAGPVISTPNNSTSAIAFNLAGTFTIQLLCTNGVNTFTSSNTITVNSSPNLTVNVANSLPICPPPTNIGGLSMSGSGAVSYTWMPGGLTASNVNVYPQPSSDITYTLYGTDGNGCPGYVTQYIPVYPLPSLFASAGSPVCAGNNICLNATGSLLIYSWQGPCGYSSFNQNDCFTAAPGCGGTFTVGGSDNNSCVNIQTVTVVVSQPTINASTTSSLLCNGQSATLSATGANSYTWNPGGNGSAIVVSPSVTTTYNLMGADNNGCISSSSITQSVAICSFIYTRPDEKNAILIYPNPISDRISVETQVPGTLLLYNAIGQKIYEQKVAAGITTCILNDFPPGVYAASIICSDEIRQVKIVKENQ